MIPFLRFPRYRRFALRWYLVPGHPTRDLQLCPYTGSSTLSHGQAHHLSPFLQYPLTPTTSFHEQYLFCWNMKRSSHGDTSARYSKGDCYQWISLRRTARYVVGTHLGPRIYALAMLSEVTWDCESMRSLHSGYLGRRKSFPAASLCTSYVFGCQSGPAVYTIAVRS